MRHFLLSIASALLLFACDDKSSPPMGNMTPVQALTYRGDVAPILAKHCVSCHSPGSIAPFSLQSYAEVSAQAESIVAATGERTMPPWGADNSGACNTFKHARWLSDDEIGKLSGWVAGGKVEGDPSLEPPQPELIPQLADSTHTLDPGVDYTPPSDRADDYRCFLVDPGLTSDQFITAFQVYPGNTRMVHHAILYSLDSAAAETEATQLDQAEAGPGYTCFGGPRVANGSSRFLVGWAPGTGATWYPEGTGVRMSGGRKAVLQIHYNLANGIAADRTRLELKMAANVQNEALIVPIADLDMQLPPRLERTETTFQMANPFPLAIRIHGVAPHMHTLGRSLRVEYTAANGTTQCLVDVPRWDFHWQQLYLYESPLRISPGGQVKLTCSYDTRERNTPVTWGEGTQDEMCLNYFYVTF